MTVPMYKKHAMFMYWMCVLVQLSGYLTLKLQQNMQYSTEMYLEARISNEHGLHNTMLPPKTFLP